MTGSNLEAEFHQAMIGLYEGAIRHCNYRASIFRHMVLEHGGREAANRLLADPDLQIGFTEVYLCGRLDLTVEHLVLNQPWSALFEDTQLEIARTRLGAHGMLAADLPQPKGGIQDNLH